MKPDDKEGEIIFVKWITNWKTGKRVYPKNGKVFAIKVKPKASK